MSSVSTPGNWLSHSQQFSPFTLLALFCMNATCIPGVNYCFVQENSINSLFNFDLCQIQAVIWLDLTEVVHYYYLYWAPSCILIQLAYWFMMHIIIDLYLHGHSTVDISNLSQSSDSGGSTLLHSETNGVLVS